MTTLLKINDSFLKISDSFIAINNVVIPQLETPTLLNITTEINTAILGWSGVANNEGYELYYKLSVSATWIKYSEVGKDVLAGLITGLSPGSEYDFSIIALGDGVNYINSERSNVLTDSTTAIPQLTTPTISEQTKDIESITIEWTTIANNEGYLVQYKESVSSTYIDFGTTSQDATESTITGLDEATSYDIRIKAIADGFNYVDSEFSNVLTIETESGIIAISDTLETLATLNEVGDTVLPSKVATQRAILDSVIESNKKVIFDRSQGHCYNFKYNFNNNAIVVFVEYTMPVNTIQRLFYTADDDSTQFRFEANQGGVFLTFLETLYPINIRNYSVDGFEKRVFILDNINNLLIHRDQNNNNLQINIPTLTIPVELFTLGGIFNGTKLFTPFGGSIKSFSMGQTLPTEQQIQDFYDAVITSVPNAIIDLDTNGVNEKVLYNKTGLNNLEVFGVLPSVAGYDAFENADNQKGSDLINDFGYRIAGNGTDFLNSDGTGVIDQGTKIPAINSTEAASFDSLGNHQPLTVTGEVNYYANVSDNTQSLLADDSNSVTFDVCPALVQIDTDSFLFTTITVDNEDLQTPVTLVNSDFDIAPTYIKVTKNGNRDITRIQIER